MVIYYYIKTNIYGGKVMRKKQMKIKKNTKGITLIALVVTIVILLILTGVSVAMLIGNSRHTRSSTKC